VTCWNMPRNAMSNVALPLTAWHAMPMKRVCTSEMSFRKADRTSERWLSGRNWTRVSWFQCHLLICSFGWRQARRCIFPMDRSDYDVPSPEANAMRATSRSSAIGSALSWLHPVKNFMPNGLHAILLAKGPIVRLDITASRPAMNSAV
jgi:hypothetical protein